MSAPTQAGPRPTRPAFGPARMMGAGMPAEKALDFKGSSRRLLGVLRPQRVLLTVVLWAPWSRGRRDTYRTRTYREVPPDEVPPDEVPPARRYPGETRYVEEEYRR